MLTSKVFDRLSLLLNMLPSVQVHTGYLVIPVDAFTKRQRPILPSPVQLERCPQMSRVDSPPLVAPILTSSSSSQVNRSGFDESGNRFSTSNCCPSFASTISSSLCTFDSSTNQKRLCSVMKNLCGQSNWKKTLQYLSSDEFKSFQVDLEAGRVPNINELVDKVTFRKRTRTDNNVSRNYMKTRSRNINKTVLASQTSNSSKDVFDELNVPPESLANIFAGKSPSIKTGSVTTGRLKSKHIKPKAPLMRVVHAGLKPAQRLKNSVDLSASHSHVRESEPFEPSQLQLGTIGTQTEVGERNVWLDIMDSTSCTSQTQTAVYEPWMKTLTTNFLSVEALHMGTQTPVDYSLKERDLLGSYNFSNMSTQTAAADKSSFSSFENADYHVSSDVSTQTKLNMSSVVPDNVDFSVSFAYPVSNSCVEDSTLGDDSARSLSSRAVVNADGEELRLCDLGMEAASVFADIDQPPFGNCGTQTNLNTWTAANHSGTQTCYELLKGLIDADIETMSSSTQTQTLMDSIFKNSSNLVTLSNTETQTAFTFNDLFDPGFIDNYEDDVKDINHIETQTLAPGFNFIDSWTQTALSNNAVENDPLLS